ncbi:RNA polymerase sigma factor [Aestuariispira insulae]|uniref:RNA polymerase sigma-70 factor (ECF subfamily) n=1 Tax=Aestuariispira insulae TaxID=1461337 RepID=A0A3D9HRK3_9PROT|nr:RNA polymerase sigma factor [Aestuariispira insulae]RED52143.1 RNA polymerase sigma-70 factor (ECF subfamily) [Aestuariispira insulae]
MSYRTILAELQPECQAYALAVCRNRDDARDLVQNAFVRAMTTSSPPKDLTKIRSWMFRIIRNLHLDLVRKRAVRREYFEARSRLNEEVQSPAICPEDMIAFRRAFEKLTLAHREILYLVDIAGMTYEETAQVMGIPGGTVMSRISRARAALIALCDDGKSK